MKFALDLTKRCWTHRRAELLVIGTWYLGEDQYRPCIVLLRASDEGREDAAPCVVPIDVAWIWSEQVGDPKIAVTVCREFAETLRLNINNHQNIRRIAYAIHDHLGDLLKMPPVPSDFVERDTFADLIITNRQTGERTELEVKDV